MNESSLPPERQSVVKSFNPLDLDRTVIALPLLLKMQADLDRLKQVPTYVREKFNAAILFNPRFPGGIAAAHAEAVRMAADAARVARETARKRTEPPHPDAETERVHKAADAALEQAVAEQTIEEVEPGKDHAFARLHATVIRRLLALNERPDENGAPRPRAIEAIYPERFEIIIDLNQEHPGGRNDARKWVLSHLPAAKERAQVRDAGQDIHWEKSQAQTQYLFACLEARAIQKLVELDREHAERAAKKCKAELGPKAAIDPAKFRAIYHIWPDFEISALINKSLATVKADAAQAAFSAQGSDITWAVMDTGIDPKHPHFAAHQNITPGWHRDFTLDGTTGLTDPNGHGTHVAGIIAGEWRVKNSDGKMPVAVSRYRRPPPDTGQNPNPSVDAIEYQATTLEKGISGMAPQCRLVSLRVLDEFGKGSVSNLIAAISHIQEINGHGRRLLIHGVNMSVGYTFEPEWFACGQSPLCVEVDRLVKSGVVVVVAAGNTGYGTLKSSMGATTAGMALTINDPGNADLAITVGSTHRDMPHVYGVSYFSSKGPTGDGRLKPDLVAPGEKIVSCATGLLKKDGAKGQECDYVETSGTSMAAPHVSGVIAGFLSVRREFIGQPERVKEIFLNTATDLRRDRYFQGAGLVDLMRAIQSV